VAKPTNARRPPAPAPVAMAPLVDFDEELDDGADDVDVPATGAAELEPELDPEPEPVVVVLLEAGGVPSAADALAVVWNVAKLLLAVGLMAKTIPCSQ
jgi:hypothetical protein